MGKIIGLDALQSAVQGKLEPMHKTQTVTGTNGSVTIQNMLEAPIVEFSATGMGTPTVVPVPGISASEQGQQDWDTPLILDVPLGILPTQNGLDYGFANPVLLKYGGGVGSNTYMPISGIEEGTTVYLTSKELASYFTTMDNNENASITYEGDVGDKGCYTFACPLPFGVAENSVVYCSHLKNQNVALTEGIWVASGNMLYIRAYSNHLNNEWGKMADDIERIGKNCIYYSPFGNFSDPSFCDFFIMLTAVSSFTKDGDSAMCSMESGAQSLGWLKISDYLTLFGAIGGEEGEEEEEEEEGDPITLTPLTSVSVTYYLDTAVNRQSRNFSLLLAEKRMQIPQLGYAASADEGGAVGYGASTRNGGAVGSSAKTRDGGAVGSYSVAVNGGAVGDETNTINGGAVGVKAYSEGGGAVGEGAKTTDGAAVGSYARCYANGEPIDAVQLGTGINETAGTMQVYSYQMMDSNGNIPLARLSEAEPAHKTQTVTVSDGSITITDALDAPVAKFSATGMGTPSVMGSVAMGSQTWSNPMVLDVPIGVVDSNSDALFLNYGGGIGSNTFVPTIGEETGNLIYYNSKQLADFFDYVDDQKTGTVTDEANSYELFTCNLPFAVEDGSTIYCSHLKNQNVSGEEGIWASGSTLYIRAQKENSGRTFEGFAERLKAIAMNCNFYDPYNPVGVESYNFQDFFIMFSASANYTKETDRVSVFLENGSKTLYYFKISDYLAAVQETTPNPTLMSDISVTYYLDTEINQNQNNYTNLLIDKRFNGIASLGSGAVAQFGGAVGEGALENYGGFAGGYHAKASTGGAVGAGASTNGGQGGAVGAETIAVDGGAIGNKAKTSDGAAIGKNAKCENSGGDPIDAIQFGTGTNQTPYSMQVYSTTLLRPRYEGSYSGGLVIPLSLITDSCNAASVSEQNNFIMNLDILLGNIVRYSITNDLVGRPVGTFVKLTSNGTVSEAIDNGDVFIGQLAEVPSGNTALVRIKGIMETEASLNLGLQRVAFSDGALDVSANGREIFVTSSDNGKITFIV